MTNHCAKAVFVGMSSVGKTSLIRKLIYDDFDIDDALSTVTAACFTLNYEVNGNPVKLQIWDTAGQERYKAMTSMYFRSAEFVFIVFDLGNEISFQQVDYWLKISREKSPTAKLFLLGNKCDLPRIVS
jgi:small GTP-binding protein